MIGRGSEADYTAEDHLLLFGSLSTDPVQVNPEAFEEEILAMREAPGAALSTHSSDDTSVSADAVFAEAEAVFKQFVIDNKDNRFFYEPWFIEEKKSITESVSLFLMDQERLLHAINATEYINKDGARFLLNNMDELEQALAEIDAYYPERPVVSRKYSNVPKDQIHIESGARRLISAVREMIPKDICDRFKMSDYVKYGAIIFEFNSEGFDSTSSKLAKHYEDIYRSGRGDDLMPLQLLKEFNRMRDNFIKPLLIADFINLEQARTSSSQHEMSEMDASYSLDRFSLTKLLKQNAARDIVIEMDSQFSNCLNKKMVDGEMLETVTRVETIKAIRLMEMTPEKSKILRGTIPCDQTYSISQLKKSLGGSGELEFALVKKHSDHPIISRMFNGESFLADELLAVYANEPEERLHAAINWLHAVKHEEDVGTQQVMQKLINAADSLFTDVSNPAARAERLDAMTDVICAAAERNIEKLRQSAVDVDKSRVLPPRAKRVIRSILLCLAGTLLIGAAVTAFFLTFGVSSLLSAAAATIGAQCIAAGVVAASTYLGVGLFYATHHTNKDSKHQETPEKQAHVEGEALAKRMIKQNNGRKLRPEVNLIAEVDAAMPAVVASVRV